ncbi:MAG: hypothetical protein LBQ06_01020 [Frankiaceae bacterium]|jgi:chromosome segregation ATPase|nr:hypothetical protein [Frankiaceae bacterium]
MTQPPKPRWWRASRDQAQLAARQSQGRAAQQLVALDAALGGAREAVRGYGELDPGPAARGLEAAWAPVDARADAAMTEYLEAVAAQDLDSDVEEWVAQYAVGLFEGIGERLRLATRAIEAFQADHGEQFNRARALRSVLPAAIAEAREALAGARQAIDAARAQGFLALEAQAELDAAAGSLRQWEQRALAADAGAAAERLRAIHGIGERAAAIAESARGSGAQRDRLASRMLSLRTAAQAAAGQAAALPQILSELRRDFAAPAYAAVEKDAMAVPDQLARVDPLLAEAARALSDDQQRYGDAAARLAEARGAVDAARGATHAVADRLSALNAVRADPSTAWETARHALRDAQRFVSDRHPVDAAAAARLDGLARQLDGSRGLLSRGPRPDFGGYLDALEAVRVSAGEVVASVRAGLASPPPGAGRPGPSASPAPGLRTGRR